MPVVQICAKAYRYQAGWLVGLQHRLTAFGGLGCPRQAAFAGVSGDRSEKHCSRPGAAPVGYRALPSALSKQQAGQALRVRRKTPPQRRPRGTLAVAGRGRRRRFLRFLREQHQPEQGEKQGRFSKKVFPVAGDLLPHQIQDRCLSPGPQQATMDARPKPNTGFLSIYLQTTPDGVFVHHFVFRRFVRKFFRNNWTIPQCLLPIAWSHLA